MRHVLAILALSSLMAACASAPTRSGFLSSYDGLAAREGGVRARQDERRDEAALAQVRSIAIEPTQIAEGVAPWMTPQERALLTREVDAQLCFELTERYELRAAGQAPDAIVRAAITDVAPTGRVASALSAAASVVIPGPIGLRAPGATGALAVEAEMLKPDGQQLAALSWSRAATAVGTDTPSLSRIGDALQFAEPFGDEAGDIMRASTTPLRTIPQPDPCAEYGPRFRPEGWLTKFVTNLYVPQVSGAKAE